ncbi:hypothetical protein FH972_023450 [Carpinus fangiana]|uniref:Transcription elongation factor Eaf N-terminal domain-containing protein n=1 Tax=Carpinus fangiana TaxID=176857 RepID=A0A5N6KVU1_9ROSI|nr:hypothetical protein FH972_023450 [Carpinus fangiana]
MAAATSPQPAQGFPDPSKPSKYPVRLAPINHKPSQVGPHRTTTITKSARGDDLSCNLTISDDTNGEASQVKYKGHRSDGGQDMSSYILMYDHEQHNFTLNPVEDEYDFNIVSTPWESDADKLRRDYKQILREDAPEDSRASPKHVSSSTDDDDALPGDLDAEPDKANPFDFRHFLDAPSSPPTNASRMPSTNNTPLRLASSPVPPTTSSFARASPHLKPQPAKATPLMKPRKHQRNISTSSLGPGRVAEKPKEVKEKKRPEPIPTVKLDRKASTRPDDPQPRSKKPTRDDTDDDDILIIEGEDDEDEITVHTPALRGTPLGGRPVSLSQLATSGSPVGFDRSDDEEDEDDLQDDDVQSMTLGTPAHRPEADDTHLRVPASRVQQDDNDAEEDPDLIAIEAELMSGLESEDDEDAIEVSLPGISQPPSSQQPAPAEDSDFLALRILPLHRLRNVHRHLRLGLRVGLDRRAQHLVARHDARPDVSDDLLVRQVVPLVVRPALAPLAAGADNAHLEDLRGRHLGAGGRRTRLLPAAGDDAVSDLAHGPQLLGLVGDGVGEAVHDGAAVVVRVRVGRQRQHEAVDQRRRDCHRQALARVAVAVGVVGQPHDAARDVAVQVDVARRARRRRVGGDGLRRVVRPRTADHGQHGGEGVVAVGVGGEGDVHDARLVDDRVDEVVVVDRCHGWMGQTAECYRAMVQPKEKIMLLTNCAVPVDFTAWMRGICAAVRHCGGRIREPRVSCSTEDATSTQEINRALYTVDA